MTVHATLTVAVLAITLGGCQRELMKTPNLYARGMSDAFSEVPPALQGNDVTLLYATDRNPEPEAKGNAQYGYDRSPSLAIGEVVVNIGGDLDWDTLVEASQQQSRKKRLTMDITTIKEMHRFPATPSPMQIVGNRRLPSTAWLEAYTAVEDDLHDYVSARLAQTPCKEAFVYVHGFANDFDDAAYTWAETWHFLGRKGIPIVYTWPAGRQMSGRGYLYDRQSGEFTILHLRQFLRSLASCPDLEKIHLLAHSRGTAVITSALRELSLEVSGGAQDNSASLKLGNVVLAAADLDFDVAQQRIAGDHIGAMMDWITIYSSGHDLALKFSDLLSFGQYRLGQADIEDYPPALREMIEVIPNISMVYVSAKTGGTGHSYFHSNPAVASDLVLLLGENRRPGDDGRPLKPIRSNYWELAADYPTAPTKP